MSGRKQTEASSKESRRGRRTPRQGRARELVDAIRTAGRLILEEEGPEALTTNRIAERAGVSIGSLYQYFDNKEEIIAEVYAEETEDRFRCEGKWALGEAGKLPTRELLRTVYRKSVERYRHQLRLHEDYYRKNHMTHSVGLRPVEEGETSRQAAAGWFLKMLFEARKDELRVKNIEHAAFLMGPGISAIFHHTIENDPQRIFDDAYIDEVLNLVDRYLFKPGRGEAARPAPEEPGSSSAPD